MERKLLKGEDWKDKDRKGKDWKSDLTQTEAGKKSYHGDTKSVKLNWEKNIKQKNTEIVKRERSEEV